MSAVTQVAAATALVGTMLAPSAAVGPGPVISDDEESATLLNPGRSMSQSWTQENQGEPSDDGGLTGPVESEASGDLSVAPLSGLASTTPGTTGDADAADMTVLIETEDGLAVDEEIFADVVMEILGDERGWRADGDLDFTQVDAPEANADIRIILATPDLVDEMCAPLPTEGYTSCRVEDRAIINAARWEAGAEAFTDAGGSVEEYRAYVINHEVGHVLGHDHVECPGAGELAPVMLQQTLDVGECAPNGWPNPNADTN